MDHNQIKGFSWESPKVPGQVFTKNFTNRTGHPIFQTHRIGQLRKIYKKVRIETSQFLQMHKKKKEKIPEVTKIFQS